MCDINLFFFSGKHNMSRDLKREARERNEKRKKGNGKE